MNSFNSFFGLEHEAEDIPSRNPAVEGADAPKLVYICAPLRGDVEANIERAREYAREVFLQGNIPICPHIYFTQFADVNDPCEDRLAMDMGLALLERCNQINIHADPPTSGMRGEIETARQCGVTINRVEDERVKPAKRQPCR